MLCRFWSATFRNCLLHCCCKWCKVGGVEMLVGATPTQWAHKKGHWGSQLSILCPAPRVKHRSSMIPHPPTYAVDGYVSSIPAMAGSLSKPLVRMRCTDVVFFHFSLWNCQEVMTYFECSADSFEQGLEIESISQITLRLKLTQKINATKTFCVMTPVVIFWR